MDFLLAKSWIRVKSWTLKIWSTFCFDRIGIGSSENAWYFWYGPLPGFQWPPGWHYMFRIGDSYESSLSTVTGRGEYPNETDQWSFDVVFLELIPNINTHYTSEHEHGTPHQIRTWNRKVIMSLSMPLEPVVNIPINPWVTIVLSLSTRNNHLDIESFDEYVWRIVSNHLTTPVN